MGKQYFQVLFEKSLEQIPIAVLVIDRNEKISYINLQFLKMFSVKKEKLLNMSFHDLFSTKIQKEIKRSLKEIWHGETDKVEYPVTIFPHNPKKVFVEFVPVIDDVRDAFAVLVTFYDYTAEKQYRLDKTRFEEQAMMIEKFSALGRLATTVVHQINNPLEAIKNYLYLLKDAFGEDAEDTENKDIITQIENEVFRIARLTRQIVEFTVPTSLQFIIFNPVDLLEETLTLMRKKIGASNIILKKNYDKKVSPINVLVGQLKQVFINIIFNSIEAMPNGGTLTINIEQLAESIEIKFEDTGEGIKERNLKKIFDPFYSSKKSDEHIGLGLSVALHIIHNHGGSIRVESQRKKSTCVIITLPTVFKTEK